MAIANIENNELGSSVRGKLNATIDTVNTSTGWGDYVDTQYTAVSPFSVVGGVVTALPNNRGTAIESQVPADIVTLYDGTSITGRNGDGLGITFDFKVIPTEVAATEIQIFIDITGGTGTPVGLTELYKRLETFEKGVGVEKAISFTIMGYTLGTWEANGGVVKVLSNGNVDIHSARYVLHATHRAR